MVRPIQQSWWRCNKPWNYFQGFWAEIGSGRHKDKDQVFTLSYPVKLCNRVWSSIIPLHQQWWRFYWRYNNVKQGYNNVIFSIMNHLLTIINNNNISGYVLVNIVGW